MRQDRKRRKKWQGRKLMSVFLKKRASAKLSSLSEKGIRWLPAESFHINDCWSLNSRSFLMLFKDVWNRSWNGYFLRISQRCMLKLIKSPLLHGIKGFVIPTKSFVKIGKTKIFCYNNKMFSSISKRLVAATKKKIFVFPTFVAVTKPFFSVWLRKPPLKLNGNEKRGSQPVAQCLWPSIWFSKYI